VVTPAAGLVGPMGAIILGLIASPIAVVFCSMVKQALNYDDSLDVFGIHGVCGIIGAIGTGVFVSADLGGVGVDGYTMTGQVTTQAIAVGVSFVWSAVASIVVFGVLKFAPGLRVKKEIEQEGIDINEHGEVAYHT
jgi:Amt family ammonium transporter